VTEAPKAAGPLASRTAPDVLLTVDVEPDCPPYLTGWRGVEEGLPRLLALLADEGVTATFFVTGQTAERYPDAVRALVAERHELGCHGHTHRRFGTLGPAEVRNELGQASRVLRAFAPTTAFRAPNLDLPGAFLSLLVEEGYRVDSSEGSHRVDHRVLRVWRNGSTIPGLLRLPVSTTSSALRLPALLRDPWLVRLRPPVVLYLHPWELVDLTGERLPWDCRAGTGPRALAAVREVIHLFRARAARFGAVRDWADAA